MAEEYESFREVSIALEGVRAQIDASIQGVKDQIKILMWGGGLFAVAVLGGGGFLYEKMGNLETGNARLETRLDAIEGKLDQIVADAGFIRENIRTASAPVKPGEKVFPGYVGFPLTDQAEAQKVQALIQGATDGPIWVYLPEK